MACPVGSSLPLISTFQAPKNIEMTSKNISQSTSFKVVDSKFSAKVEGILGVTFGSVGAVTRSKATILGQQTLQVSLLKNLSRSWLCLRSLVLRTLPQRRAMTHPMSLLHMRHVM